MKMFAHSLLFFALVLIQPCRAAAQDNLHDPKIAGTVMYNQMDIGAEFEGRLVLELNKSGKPFAKTEVFNPRFPQAYLLGPKNTLTPGMPFEGEFSLKATLKDQKGTDVALANYNNVLAGSRGIILTLEKPVPPAAQ